MHLTFLNPFRPNIHVQILQTDLLPILEKLVNRICQKKTKYFPFGDHFIDSHNLCIDIVRRK